MRKRGEERKRELRQALREEQIIVRERSYEHSAQKITIIRPRDVAGRSHKNLLHWAILYTLTYFSTLRTCSADRYFSALKILKSRLLSTTNDQCLSALTMLFINEATAISMERAMALKWKT